MPFEKYKPSTQNKRFIENYWIVEDTSSEPQVQKIIPDGFTEIIFHYGDVYAIERHGHWQTQARQLIAGQIRKFFLLKNTGTSGILGIKFRPTALTHLFRLNMIDLTDTVVDLHDLVGDRLEDMETTAFSTNDAATKVALIDDWVSTLVFNSENEIDKAVQLTFERFGLVSVSELCATFFVTERQLERNFRKYVGLSPKFFARIVRFNLIFRLIQDKKLTWSDIAFQSGYYDHSHFVKNFKSFTGEDPSKYIFEDKTLANFFLLKEPI